MTGRSTFSLCDLRGRQLEGLSLGETHPGRWKCGILQPCQLASLWSKKPFDRHVYVSGMFLTAIYHKKNTHQRKQFSFNNILAFHNYTKDLKITCKYIHTSAKEYAMFNLIHVWQCLGRVFLVCVAFWPRKKKDRRRCRLQCRGDTGTKYSKPKIFLKP